MGNRSSSKDKWRAMSLIENTIASNASAIYIAVRFDVPLTEPIVWLADHVNVAVQDAKRTPTFGTCTERS